VTKAFSLRILIIALAIAWLLPPIETYAQTKRPTSARPLIKRTYDKFHDTTSVSPQGTILIGDNAMFDVHFDYAGTSQPQSIEAFRLLFIAPPSVWVGNSDSALIYVLLNDRQPSKQIEAKYSSTFQVANIVSTVYSTTVSKLEFRDIACANGVEMRIGLSEGALKPKDVAALKEVFQASGETCR
jgi:hypothetical protein